MKKKILAFLQLAIGISIVAALLYSINKNTKLVVFTLAQRATVAEGAVYSLSTNPAAHFVVKAAVADGTELRALPLSKGAAGLPETGMLARLEGSGPDSLGWSARRLDAYGLRLMGDTFRAAADHWPILLFGFSFFFWCFLLCAYRWQLLLRALDLHLSYGRVLALYFVGHFFSAMLPGVTGGDLIKAIYAAREAPHKRTAAVTSIVIDRIVGLVALVIVAIVIMLLRLPLFLASMPMKIALAFNLFLLAGIVVGMLVLFRRNLLEHWGFFRRLEQKTALGEIIGKAYSAFHVCMTHPALLAKTLALSAVNHLTYNVMVYFLALGLGVRLSLVDTVTAFVIINAVAAIPLTPGGLGTREGTAIFILSVFGVSAATAFSISILVYAAVVGWGLLSGIVYLFYIYWSGPVNAAGQPPGPGPA